MPQVRWHEPVMADEVVALFAAVPAGLVVDATAGTGGHSEALLTAHAHLRLLCLDRDPEAVRVTSERLSEYGGRATVRHARFDRLGEEAALAGAGPGSLSGVFFDLGVSSLQLDTPERGFSYWHDGPLDMRMDPTVGPTAADVVNGWDEDELAGLFADNGEGRFARRIARAVVRDRPVSSTGQLSEVVRGAIPAAARRHGGHPARRVFQALRVAVNEELGLLSRTLPEAIAALAPGGRCVALSYHSGEDRLVKSAFARRSPGAARALRGYRAAVVPGLRVAWSSGAPADRGPRRPPGTGVPRALVFGRSSAPILLRRISMRRTALQPPDLSE